MLRRIPEGVAEAIVVFDRHRIDRSLGDFEAALLEHHHRRVVDARALGKDQNRQIVLGLDVLAHLLGDHVPVLGLRAFEPNVIGRLRERPLNHAEESAVFLSNHRKTIIGGENDHIDGRRMVSDADGIALGTVLRVMVGDDGREHARQDPVQDDVDVEPVAYLGILNGKEFEKERRAEHPENSEDEQAETKWKQETVSCHEAEKPQRGDAKGERAVLLLSAREQIPDGHFLGRGEPFGHLVVDDRFEALTRVVHDIAQLELNITLRRSARILRILIAR